MLLGVIGTRFKFFTARLSDEEADVIGSPSFRQDQRAKGVGLNTTKVKFSL